MGAGGLGEDAGRPAERGRVCLRRVRQVARRRGSRAVADRPGFGEWYGPPRTYDEALWPTDPWYDPDRDPVSRMVEIRRGEPDVTEGDQLTLDVRRDCDLEYLRRPRRSSGAAPRGETPFFVVLQPFADAHAGDPAAGVQGPQRAGRLGRQPAGAGRRLRRPAGPARRSSAWPMRRSWCSPGTTAPRTSCSGAARPATGRAPTSPAARATCAPRAWFAGPATSQPAGASDEIMHVTDWFTTLLRAAGAGRAAGSGHRRRRPARLAYRAAGTSAREGYIYWMGPEMYGVKWHNFKLVLVAQSYMQDAADKLPTPRSDQPHHRPARTRGRAACRTCIPGSPPISTASSPTSTRAPRREPPIPLGAPLDHVPE